VVGERGSIHAFMRDHRADEAGDDDAQLVLANGEGTAISIMLNGSGLGVRAVNGVDDQVRLAEPPGRTCAVMSPALPPTAAAGSSNTIPQPTGCGYER